MKKHLLFKACAVIIAMTLAPALRAQNVDCLRVALTDGTATLFALAHEPEVTYEGDALLLTIDGTCELSVALEEVAELTYVYDEATAIRGAVAPLADADVSFAAGKAYITGLTAGATVSLYTAAGQLVASVAASADGNVCVDLAALPTGVVYLLRTHAATYKVLNK